MSFKSVLDKIKEEATLGANVAALFYPFLRPLVGLIPGSQKVIAVADKVMVQVPDRLQQIVHDIQDVQAMFAAAQVPGPGSAKAKAIAPKLAALLMDCEVVGGKAIGKIIKDPAKFNAAVEAAAGNIADALNACEAQ